MVNASTWKRSLVRLTSMDRRELFDRLRQYLTARTDVLRYRGGSEGEPDVRSAGASGRFYFTPAEVPSLCAVLKQIFPAQSEDVIVQAEKICRHRFDLLATGTVLRGGDRLALRRCTWQARATQTLVQDKVSGLREVGDSKITWELSRHQHFVTLAKAYWLSGEDKFAREILAQWAHWHKENPYPIGINWASSLEVAYRSLSWVWTFFLLQECPLFTSDLRRQWQLR